MAVMSALAREIIQLVLPIHPLPTSSEISMGEEDDGYEDHMLRPLQTPIVCTDSYVVDAMCATCGRVRAKSDAVGAGWQGQEEEYIEGGGDREWITTGMEKFVARENECQCMKIDASVCITLN